MNIFFVIQIKVKNKNLKFYKFKFYKNNINPIKDYFKKSTDIRADSTYSLVKQILQNHLKFDKLDTFAKSIQQYKMQTPKLIPFKQIRPVKFFGISSTMPFSSLITESKLLYFSGRSIILQNLKTYQQKQIWTNQFTHTPEVIQHLINIHRQNIVGIVIKDQTGMYMVVIMNINSQINNYEHLNKKQREKDRIHYLKNVNTQTKSILKFRFLHQGSLFAVLVGDINDKNNMKKQKNIIQKQKYNNKENKNIPLKQKNIFIYSSLSGDLLYSLTLNSVTPLIQGLQLNRLNYICIIKNIPEQTFEDPFILLKKGNNSSKQFINNDKCKQALFKVSLLNSSELSNKNDFIIQLKEDQKIMEVKFFENHKKTISFFLLTSGYVLLFMVNERGFHDCVRVDVRINKQNYCKQMKQENDKMIIMSKQTEQDEESNTLDIQLRQKATDNKKQDLIQYLRSPHNQAIQTSKKSSFLRQSKNDPPNVNNNSTYYYPNCITCTNGKVVIGYQHCEFIGMISYSSIDHRQHKFQYIFDFFNQKEHIQSIRKINFSEDGCHCSVLVKVEPGRIQPNKKKRNQTKIQNKYKIAQNKLKKEGKPKSINTNLSIASNSQQLSSSKLKSQQQLNDPGRLTTNKKQKRALISSVVTPQCCNNQQDDQERQHFEIYHIDFISGLIEHEYHSEAIQQSLSVSSLKGTVQLTFFNHSNNTMFILLSSGSLFYYHLNTTNINSEKDFLGSGKSSLSTLKKKLENNNFFKQKSVQNYLSPESVLLWVQKIKIKPSIIVCHPIVFQIVLVFQDNIKFHFYNYDKIYQSHHVLSLKNCKAATYSPYGDKLALGTVGSIWLVDSYTHQIIKKIPLVIFPTSIKNAQQKPTSMNVRRSESIFTSLSSKTVSKIQFISNEDLILQTGNTTLSMLLNYDKVLYYGGTQTVASQLLAYDYKHRLGVIATDNWVKVVTKCSINSKNKCQELAKIQIKCSAIKLCGQIDTLFIGGQNGILYFIRWPQFFQNQSIKTPNSSNRLHLFHSPIVNIEISINYRQLFVLSKQGMIVICELAHSDQVQKIGKDVSFMMSKKIDLPLPLLNKWLVSTCDQQRRAQSITKLMGNEAQVKNNQIILAEEYKKQLQNIQCSYKLQLEQDLKRQIKKYEVDSGISKLQLQIVFAKDQIKRVSGKRQLEYKLINENIDEDLHNVFVERQRLQKQLKQLQLKSSTNKQDFIKQTSQQLLSYQHLIEQQLKQKQGLNIQSRKMYEQKRKVDLFIDQNTKQDFMEEKQQIQKHYNQLLSQIYQKNNSLMSINRNKKVQIIQITDKNRQLSARMYQLEVDVDQLQKDRVKVDQTKSNLSQLIIQTDKKYHSLIKRTKQFQTTLNKIRTSSESCQMKYNDLQDQIQIMQEKWTYLEKQKDQAEIDFGEQFKLKTHNTTQLQQIQIKITDLKQKRKITFDNYVLLKDLIKIYQPSSQDPKIINLTPMDQDHLQTTNNNIQSILQVKKDKTTKLTSDVQKWNHVKDDNRSKFIKYNQRMQQENNKLIYRFNQLQKEFKQWIKLQKKIKNDINLEKQKQKYNQLIDLTKKSQENSFVAKVSEDQRIPRKTNSINRQNSITNKFNSTSCHFSSPKSLSREITVTNVQPLNSIFRIRQQQNQPQLNKKSVKDMNAFISEKRQLLKDKKQNSILMQLKYHGVLLDKNTLKPKKTMCLSLHQSGQNQGKFVTQY